MFVLENLDFFFGLCRQKCSVNEDEDEDVFEKKKSHYILRVKLPFFIFSFKA